MKGVVKEVYFERIFNLGNYENIKIGLTATVSPSESAEAVVKELDARIAAMVKR